MTTYSDIYPTQTYVTEEPQTAELPEALMPEQEAEFAELYANMYPKMLNRARSFKKLRDPEGTTQMAFMKAFKKWNTYKEQGKNRDAWINRILFNTAVSETRHNNLYQEDLASDDFQYDNAPDASVDTEFDAIVSQYGPTMECIKDLLDTNSHQWYESFVLHTLQGYSHAEISKITGIKVGTIQSSIHRARKILASDPELVAALGRSLDKEPEDAINKPN